MPQRLILHFDIEDRQQELRDFAAPDDFVLRRRDTEVPFPAQALAYCADLQAERVLFTTHGSGMAKLFAAPFLYAAQLQGAVHVVSVPYERLGEVEPALPGPPPVLVFSLGRTGSTLLTRLLMAASAPCASEPDMLAQICRFGREDRRSMGLPMEPALMRACLVALGAALGAALGGGTGVISPFIKLRSQCNARPLPLVEAIEGARAIFMLRRARPWAVSRHRAFGETPESVAAILREAADALDKLAGSAAPLVILWFEDLVRQPGAVLRQCLGPGFIDEASIAAAMAADAQDGTAVAQAALVDAPVAGGFAEDFVRAWQRARDGAEWSPETEGLLRAMFSEAA